MAIHSDHDPFAAVHYDWLHLLQHGCGAGPQSSSRASKSSLHWGSRATEAYTQKSIFPVKGVMFLCAPSPKQERRCLLVLMLLRDIEIVLQSVNNCENGPRTPQQQEQVTTVFACFRDVVVV